MAGGDSLGTSVGQIVHPDGTSTYEFGGVTIYAPDVFDESRQVRFISERDGSFVAQVWALHDPFNRYAGIRVPSPDGIPGNYDRITVGNGTITAAPGGAAGVDIINSDHQSSFVRVAPFGVPSNVRIHGQYTCAVVALAPADFEDFELDVEERGAQAIVFGGFQPKALGDILNYSYEWGPPGTTTLRIRIKNVDPEMLSDATAQLDFFVLSVD